MGEVRSYRDLLVWQNGMDLATAAYALAKVLPKSEQYRLTSQLLRAAASVPANIAEGNARGTRKDYANFISIARGSVAEVETFLDLAVRVELVKIEQASHAMSLSDELGRMMNVMRERLAKNPD
ncbi:MAG: four helix bundle protein [Hyphomicrobium sp.]